jgi:signal transduction histidine kinase
MAGEIEDGWGLTVDVVAVGDCDLTETLRPIVAAAREAMTNAAKHAGATHAAIEVWVDRGELVAEVRDDGAGGAHAAPGGGLAGLADRLSAVGGAVTVSSPRGAGTCVRIRVPL